MEASFTPTLEMDFPAESPLPRSPFADSFPLGRLSEELTKLQADIAVRCRQHQELKEEAGQLGQLGQLQAEVARLQRANLEVRQQAGYWQSRHRDALARIAELEQTIAQLEAEKRQLQNDLFGRQTEKHSQDRSNDLHDPLEEAEKPKRKRGQQPGRPGPKRRDYSHLETREEIKELPAEERVCAHCGKRLSKKQWYYRNGKFFCKQRCFHENVEKAAADKAKADAKAAEEKVAAEAKTAEAKAADEAAPEAPKEGAPASS